MVDLIVVREPRREMTAAEQGDTGVSLSWGRAPVPLCAGPLTETECVVIL